MNTHDCQALIAVTFVPSLYVRQSVSTVVTTKRPKLHHDHSSTETLKGESLGIDPCTRRELGSHRIRRCFRSICCNPFDRACRLNHGLSFGEPVDPENCYQQHENADYRF